MLHSLSFPDREVYNVILFILWVHLQRQVVEPLRLCFHGRTIVGVLYKVNRNRNCDRKKGTEIILNHPHALRLKCIVQLIAGVNGSSRFESLRSNSLLINAFVCCC